MLDIIELRITGRAWITVLASVALLFSSTIAHAQKRYDPGVTDSEIKIGQTAPYSGPMSAWGTVGRAQEAYFAKINAEGGIRGRKIKLISFDDAFNPAKTVEQTRKLVERDRVLLIFNSIGSSTSAAVQKYLNKAKIPQLFVGAGDMRFGDPKTYPWTIGFHQTNYTEGKLYATYILKHHPRARIAALYINDNFGKELLKGLRDGLGDRAKQMLVATASYDLHDPTVDSQIITLHESGADIFVNFALQKAAAQAIRKIYDIGWRPTHFVNYAGVSDSKVLIPAGADKSLEIISIDNQKEPTDRQWQDDPAMKEWLTWMHEYYPQGNIEDGVNVYAYTVAQLLVHVLTQCGDDLTRENVMRQATNIKDLRLPMLLPGIKINTSPTDYYPIEQVRLLRFTGTRLEIFGDVLE